MILYDFTVPTLEGGHRSLAEYRGQVLLIVNVASKCGFTPQYTGLQKLYDIYHSRGFSVLAFPCNQFLWQEPGDGVECRLQYNVTFPVFGKIKVNGPDEHPLYTFLKDHARGTLGTRSIKWNFAKFLVNRDGQPVKRYSTATGPGSLNRSIEALLGASAGFTPP